MLWRMYVRLIMLMMALLVALVSGACESHQQPPFVDSTAGSSQAFDESDDDPDWPFWPTSMRIHPLTRVLNVDDRYIIEARVEFSDEYGSTTRCVGQLRLLLVETANDREGQIIEEWNNDLREVTANALHFDDITRTYLFRLELNSENYSPTAELHAQFLSTDATRLSAGHRLR